MSLRTQSLNALGRRIGDRLTDLASIVEVMSAPPSKPAKYPACAIVCDSTDYWLADDFVPVDADNNPLVGPDATMDLPADWGRFDEQTLIYIAGRYTMHCRIFVATRLPEQRAELEDLVFSLFLEDDLAPGRILMNMDRPTVLGRKLPWQWPVAAFMAETDEASSWTPEYVFSERLWSWLKCEVDVDIIVPRSAPMLKQIVLEFDADFAQPIDPVTGLVTDLDGGADDEVVQVDQTGDITPYP